MNLFTMLFESVRKQMTLALLGGIDDARIAIESQASRESIEREVSPGVTLLLEGPKTKAKGRGR